MCCCPPVIILPLQCGWIGLTCSFDFFKPKPKIIIEERDTRRSSRSDYLPYIAASMTVWLCLDGVFGTFAASLSFRACRPPCLDLLFSGFASFTISLRCAPINFFILVQVTLTYSNCFIIFSPGPTAPGRRPKGRRRRDASSVASAAAASYESTAPISILTVDGRRRGPRVARRRCLIMIWSSASRRRRGPGLLRHGPPPLPAA